MELTYKPIEYKKFGGGMNTVNEADDIADSECVFAQNVDFSSGGGIGPRLGKTIFGQNTSGSGSIRSAHTTNRRDGTQQPLRERGTVVEYYSSQTSQWETLVTGLTSTALSLGWADYVTSTYDRVYFGNGTDTTIKWNTAVTKNTVAILDSDVTITVTSTADFDSSGDLIINGDIIAYTAKTATTFTTVTGITAGGHAINSSVAQATSTVSGIEKGNILLVKDWRLSVAGAPTKGPTLTLSKINLPETFTESSPRLVGDADIEDFPEGGGKITGLAEKDKWWIIFKEDTIRLFTLDITASSAGTTGEAEIPITKALVTAPGIGAVVSTGIVGADNDVFYVSRKGGLRSLQEVSSSTIPQIQVADLTDLIRPTIKDYVFTDAQTMFFDKKILVSCRSSSSVTYNDTVIVYDLRTKGLGLYAGWNVGCWFIYNGSLYFGSSVDPNTYKAFDGYSDFFGSTVEAPIDVIWRSKRFNFGQSSSEKEVDLIYVEGLISPSTSLEVTLRYDEDGSRASIVKTISGTGSYVIQTPVNTLGSEALGVEPLAGTISEVSDLNKFRVYLTMPTEHALFNMDIQFRCTTVGGRWKILTYSFNPALRSEPPSHIKL